MYKRQSLHHTTAKSIVRFTLSHETCTGQGVASRAGCGTSNRISLCLLRTLWAFSNTRYCDTQLTVQADNTETTTVRGRHILCETRQWRAAHHVATLRHTQCAHGKSKDTRIGPIYVCELLQQDIDMVARVFIQFVHLPLPVRLAHSGPPVCCWEVQRLHWTPVLNGHSIKSSGCLICCRKRSQVPACKLDTRNLSE